MTDAVMSFPGFSPIDNQDLSRSRDGQAERQAIEDAIRALRVIKRDRLNFPGWESGSSGA